MHDTATPVRIGVAAVALNVILSLALLGPLRQGGLALANSIATTLEMLVLFLLLRPWLNGADSTNIATSAAKMLVGAVAMAAAILLAEMTVLAQNPLLILLGGMLIGGGAYFVTMFLLQSDEIGLAIQLARRK
jgi:putative peptidoglycan lipid II flippase